MKPEFIDYFPSKLAKGKQFCNRVSERKALRHSIELTRHTVLVSPRRYGKSSLAHQVASEMHYPFTMIDLFLAHDDQTVIRRILEGISHAVSQIMPVTQKALGVIQKYFKQCKVVFTAAGLELEISYTTALNDPIEQILDTLKALAHLAEEKQKKIIFFIDEFQDIASAESSKSIQGAIRHVAQETEWIAFVFSGSNRRLLLDLFDDRNKPLYMLCDKILLDRMSSEDYYPHIQIAAKARWDRTIDESVINSMLIISELHPFYVNLLGHELWKNKHVPSTDDVTKAWLTCYEIEERRLRAELEKLTNNQQSILKSLAVHAVQEPMSQDFLNITGLPLSSVGSGLKALLEKDLIYVVKKTDPVLPSIKPGQYRILDPLLAFTLRQYS